ncbi:MAG: hypothetical protein ACK4VV_05190 [Pseudomonas sp.]
MQLRLPAWWFLAPASLLLSACAMNMAPQDGAPTGVERTLISHSIQIDVAEGSVMSVPKRTLRITEQQLYSVQTPSGRGDKTEHYQSLPWSNRPVEVIVGDFSTQLLTDTDGLLHLNLLDDQFLNLDYDNLRVIQLVARAAPSVRAEANLLIGRELRPKLHEAVALIYDSLEEDDVDQWAYRVKRLSEIGLEEESNQLENMLILLTTGDPELQGEFIQALDINLRP